MTVFRRFCRVLALPMALVVLVTSSPFNFADAAMMSTDQIIAEDASAADRDRVLQLLAREDVRKEIIALGINPEEAARRLQSLSDAEVQQIVGIMDQDPAGQNGVLVGILIAILIIFLVLLITDLAGATDIFPFIKKQR